MGDTEAPIVFDRAADDYDATRGFPSGVPERAAALLARAGALGPTSRVLELGVGTGRIALPLASRVREVVGVDLSRPMLAKLLAKRAGAAVHVARADAARLPFADASFDAVVGVHVFHLIPRWQEVLGETARVLRPGGRLLHAADEQTDVWASWRQQVERLVACENAGVPRARFESFPEEHGWRPCEVVQRIHFARRVAPRELLDRLAKRSWSGTWKLSDADLARVVEALRAQLLERVDDLDQPVELETGFWVRAYERPGRGEGPS